MQNEYEMLVDGLQVGYHSLNDSTITTLRNYFPKCNDIDLYAIHYVWSRSQACSWSCLPLSIDMQKYYIDWYIKYKDKFTYELVLSIFISGCVGCDDVINIFTNKLIHLEELFDYVRF